MDYKDVLDFWFEDINEDTVLSTDLPVVMRWFAKIPEFDFEIKKRFGPNIRKAAKRGYPQWEKDPHGRLALVILLDQFPRNVFRDDVKAFDYDLMALEYCLRSIKENLDADLLLVERQFLYLPLMHSEVMEVQEMSLKQFGELVSLAEEEDSKNLDYFKNVMDFAQRHYDIIREFRRFPHRNQVLGRRSTSDEVAFLQNPENHF